MREGIRMKRKAVENEQEIGGVQEVVMVSISPDPETGQPIIVLNGNVSEERAALMLQMAAQISLENVVFNYLPLGASDEYAEEPDDEDEDDDEDDEDDEDDPDENGEEA
jgi:phosphopantothenoylcysteine synthetase/decarboxylase